MLSRVWLAAILVLAACGSTDPRLAEPLPELHPKNPEDLVQLLVDVGVTNDIIRFGILADLSGPSAQADTALVDAQKVYWAAVNAGGGVGGRQVEVMVIDTAADVDRHVAGYDQLVFDSSGLGSEVLALAHSSGVATTLAIADLANRDQLMVVTNTQLSRWADNPVVFAPGASYCTEAINAVSWLDNTVRGATGTPLRLAVVGDGSPASIDAVAGAREVISELGLELVLELDVGSAGGTAARAAPAALAAANPNGVFAAVGDSSLDELFAASRDLGMEATWLGNAHTIASSAFAEADFGLGDSSDGLALMQWFFVATSAIPANADAVARAEAELLHAALERAVSNGDLRREGLVQAFDVAEAPPLLDTTIYGLVIAPIGPDNETRAQLTAVSGPEPWPTALVRSCS
ncbi:MAG: ABC-type branched-subunit amino acid transport system substrate-binding protein [Acidimicrobiales bacterium]|jgi:ABC-type branched-subunit amino acid transport system substrate-binding protein